ncbi:leucyl aminopeptidase, partial [Acinetobacter baumannii]
MKFKTYTTFHEQKSNEYLWILVYSEHLQININTYKINNLESIITATQFKYKLNETLPLYVQLRTQHHRKLIG